jgi:sialic acid synthase SpsE
VVVLFVDEVVTLRLTRPQTSAPRIPAPDTPEARIEADRAHSTPVGHLLVQGDEQFTTSPRTLGQMAVRPSDRSLLCASMNIDDIWNHDPSVYVIAEVGINHNGDLDLARRLIDVAAAAGCDAVKFQKRTPSICVPVDQQQARRQTPWGEMSYLDYKERTEFGVEEYSEIARHASDAGLDWFASPWDLPSVEFLESMDVAVHKVASACLTDDELLTALATTGKPVILSTGMSTIAEIDRAVETLGTDRLVLMHSTSTYPCPPEEANLRTINTLRERYRVPVGYSGHERGLQISLAAVALGAIALERHITLDRSMWGSDHAASLEPHGLEVLVRDIRILEEAMGDGDKRVFPGEEEPRRRLRRH